MSEHDEQATVFDVCRYSENEYPELGTIYAIPNGGPRNVRVAVKLKAEGVRAGIPDICLPVPRMTSNGDKTRYYGALYIEMKYGKNKATESQNECIKALRHAGNKVEICYSSEEALDAIFEYLGYSRPSQCVLDKWL